MSAPTEVELYVCVIILMVSTFACTLVHLWNQPLRNGSAYFLGIEVPTGFYDGPGRSWMARYHAMLASTHLLLFGGLGAIVVSRRWSLTPMLSGGFALLFVSTMWAFGMWTRHKLGGTPPVRPAAIALEPRLLSDYISWPMEALVVVLIALSWWLLFRGGSHFDWKSPLVLSWVALGLLPGKMAMVRVSFPLPAERAEEHYRYQDAVRRNWISMWGAFGWSFVVLLIGGALTKAPSPAPKLRWLVVGVYFAVWGYYMIVMFRGMRQLSAMSSDLRPDGSWRSPFRGAGCVATNRLFLVWFAVWFGGILALILYSLR